MILTDRKEQKRFVKFAIVGAVGAAIDFGVMNALRDWTPMPRVYTGVISFLCAVISNFIWNRLWTYPESRAQPLLNQLGMFFLVNTAGVAIRVPILHYVEPPLLNFFQKNFSVSYKIAGVLSRNLTLAFAIGIVMLWNFFVNRYWTYKHIDHPREAQV
ncbi:MAG: hypothetical protein Fur002_22050 [Anaerolineales bacterium]